MPIGNTEKPRILGTTEAFCPHSPAPFHTHNNGPLHGLTFGVKDLLAIKHARNAAGNPSWYASHPPALTTAKSVGKLLEAGGTFTGFTRMDELASSLEGSNAHEGIIENPAVPGHYCGGSSMGSAAIVAGNIADMALGTDTGGSVRVPAAFCGIYGFRPSTGRVNTQGMIPLAPRFDTIGWFTKDAALHALIGELLLDLPKPVTATDRRLIICDAFFSLVDPCCRQAVEKALATVREHFAIVEKKTLKSEALLKALPDIHRVLQGRSCAETHREWLNTRPILGRETRIRLEAALAITDREVALAEKQLNNWQACLYDLLPEGATLALPTTPFTAPRFGETSPELRKRLLQLGAVAGLAGYPQCHLPLSSSIEDGVVKPCGISLVKNPDEDHQLLAEVKHIGSLTLSPSTA